MVLDPDKALNHVLEAFSLETLSAPVDLASLATKWGVAAIEERNISSDAMLLPSPEGYRVVLKKASSVGERVRQRFSFAHELGHLLLRQQGLGDSRSSKTKHRVHNNRNTEERLCDQIAAEILMPREAFHSDATDLQWSLEGLRRLSRRYGTSVSATANRMIALTPEQALMGIWKPAATETESHLLERSKASKSSYGIRNSDHLPRRRFWLISRAAKSAEVESGIAPMVNRKRPTAFPVDVPAEAWAWGKGEYRRVLVFYYPERELSQDMLAVANAIGPAF